MVAKSGDRVFLQELKVGTYDLRGIMEERRAQPRVWTGQPSSTDSAGYKESDPSKESKSEWRLNPEDVPLRTQSLNVHTKEIAPGGSNTGHAHQNEAVFYILEGYGYEIHDGKRYNWKAGDLVIVHADSVHRHFNASETERARCIVIKAKSLWMHMGLIQQGSIKPLPNDHKYGPREDWAQLMTPGSENRIKVVGSDDAEWELTPDGYVRVLSSEERDDVRCFSVDVYEQRIPAGSRSAKHWHMADEYLHVVEGSGYTLQWDVAAEFDDRYYARIAKEPQRWDFSADDSIYVPPNTVHQFFNDGDEPVLLLSGQSRQMKQMGYDNIVFLELAPEYADQPGLVGTSS